MKRFKYLGTNPSLTKGKVYTVIEQFYKGNGDYPCVRLENDHGEICDYLTSFLGRTIFVEMTMEVRNETINDILS